MDKDELVAIINRGVHKGIMQFRLTQCYQGELPPEIGELTCVEKLFLQDIALKVLPPEIGLLTNLSVLILSGNYLETLPPEIGLLTNLRVLIVKRNQLSYLPPEIGQLKCLQELDLGENKLTSLPQTIGQLAELRKFHINNNQLTSIPREIGCLVKLEELNAAGNSLTDIPPEIGLLSTLVELQLAENKLRSLPREIGQLVNLRHLGLGHNRLRNLPSEIGYLESLQGLVLGGNRLDYLPAAIGKLSKLRYFFIGTNSLTDLPCEIGELTALIRLDLRYNQLVSLPKEIDQLKALQELDLRFNCLTELPSEVCDLPQLQFLGLQGNQLSELPPEIGRSSRLQSLNLAGNLLTSLTTEIASLIHLRYLDLSGNHLTELPAGIDRLPNLQSLILHGNLLPLPPEFLAENNDPKLVIRAYVDFLANRTKPLNEVKLVLIGEGSVGKTSLANRLLHDSFVPDAEKTEGIAIHQWWIADRLLRDQNPDFEPSVSGIRINIWDFGGQEIMHATHQFFLTKRTLYILALDSRLSEAENRLDYWLMLISIFGGDSPVLVVGNKTDQHPLDIDRRSLLAKYPTVQAILETSCKTGAGIPELFVAIVRKILELPHVSDPLVTTWFDVKAEIEALDADYIPYRRYVELCREKHVDHPDSQRVLLSFLHDLGVVLHFPDPRLEDTNILNPEWVTQGVYRILNTHLPFAEPGVLTWDMLARILDDEPYQEKRLFIVDMMQKFELCYEIPDRPHTYLIPDLLSKEARDTGAWDNALCFEVHYSVLPGSILTRLIVRMHRRIKEQTVWRTGVLLACDGNEALVTADLAANRIAIAVRGPGTGRRELLTRIREHLEAIHASLAGLEAAEKVPVPGHPRIPPVDYKWLRELERKGVLEFYPPGLTDPISVRQLLDGVEPPSARRELERRGGNTFVTNVYGGQVGVIGDDADVDGDIHS